MRIFRIMVFVLMILLSFAPSVSAAKKRIRIRATGVSYSQARLSRQTNSIVLTLIHLENVSNVSYALSYTANGVGQGVMGSFAPSGQATDSRDLYFGTCSKGVCTPHYGIQNASLLVTTTVKNGASNIKRYRIKI